MWGTPRLQYAYIGASALSALQRHRQLIAISTIFFQSKTFLHYRLTEELSKMGSANVPEIDVLLVGSGFGSFSVMNKYVI